MTKNTVGDTTTVDNYGWSSPEGPHSCDYITPEIIDIVRRLRVQSIVDIGAGNGRLCTHLKALCDRVVGVEVDARGVEIARRQNPELQFYNLGVQGDPETVLVEQEKFEAAISTEVVEHLFAPHLLPQFAGSLLADDGVLIITTPYHGYLKNLALSLLNKWDDHHTALWHGGHIKFWSKKTLTSLLNDNGFDVIEFSGVGRVPLLWKSMVLVARKRRARGV